MEDVKDRIVLESLGLMMKYGIRSVSMDDIARHLGMSKKTIYQYVTNKKELVRLMVSQTLDVEQCGVKDISESSANALDEIIAIARMVVSQLRSLGPSLVFDMKKYYAEEWNMIEQHHKGFVHQTIQANIERGIKEGLYRNDVDAIVISQLYIAMAQCIVDEEIFPLRDYSKSDLYRSLISYHLRGIVSDKGRLVIDQQSII